MAKLTSLQLILVLLGIFLFSAGILGMLYWYSGQATDVSSIANQNVPPPENITDNHFALGNYYFNQPPQGVAEAYDLEKAAHHYKLALAESTERGEMAPLELWYNLARVDFVQARLDGAISKLEQQLEVHGDTLPQTHYMLGLAYGYRALETQSDADWKAAEDGFLTFMEYIPNSPWPRVDLAWVYFGQGKFTEMIPLLEEGIAISGEHAWLLNTYGLALLNTGNKAGAEQAFIRAQAAYDKLTVADWQKAYSENDPTYWNRNFELFGATIEYNLNLATKN